VVLYNRNVSDSTANSVYSNYGKGIKQLVEWLIETDNQLFLIVAGPKHSYAANERRVLAQKLLLRQGIENVPVIYGDHSYPGGREVFAHWAANNPLPDAIICSNDMMAIGIIDEINQNLKLRVPQEVCVVGFDGVLASSPYQYN
jgi:DNA-binding LacI/PurR family transcriptional regulator